MAEHVNDVNRCVTPELNECEVQRMLRDFSLTLSTSHPIKILHFLRLKERSSKNTAFVLCANIFQRNALNVPLYLRHCLEKEEIRKLKGRKQSILAQCEEQQEISGTVSVRMSDPNGSLRRRHNEPG